MKKIFIVLIVLVSLFSCEKREELSEYWNEQRKGTNYFNEVPTEQWFLNAQKENIELVRMTFDKWETSEEDFLIGDISNYTGLITDDLEKLKEQLDYAHKYGISIILVPLGLPGARWTQNNNMVPDGRLWQEEKYQEQAIQFWKDLAQELKNHPAIIGYNIINEPFPEKFYNKQTHWNGGFSEWYEGIKGSLADLNLFYEKVIEAIRSVDAKTTIVLDTGLHATPWAIEYLTPQKDKNVLYSFHMYEPYEFTTKRINNGRFSYPGEMYISDLNKTILLDKAFLQDFFKPVREWQKKYDIPSNQIMAGEFGIDRMTAGATAYMTDLVSIFNEDNYHWLFYAFQGGTWHAWDYQFGEDKVPYQYWDFSEEGTINENRDFLYSRVKGTAIYDMLQKELKK